MPTITIAAKLTYNRLPDLARALPREAADAVDETIKSIEERIKVGMASGKSGQMYGSHRASAPGEMPAIDTSNLAGSIDSRMTGPAEGEVSAGAEYALYLEYGAARVADGSTDMGGVTSILYPRPFMVPSAEAERPAFERRMRNLERLVR